MTDGCWVFRGRTRGHAHRGRRTRGRRAEGLPRWGCRAVHSQIRNQEISKQKHQIHEYPAQNHQRKKKPALGGCRATMPRRGAPSPYSHARSSEGGGIGRSRACSPRPASAAGACSRLWPPPRGAPPRRVAAAPRGGLAGAPCPASPGSRAATAGKEGEGGGADADARESRPRRGEVPGLAWKPRRHREKGGRGRRHGCGHERELGFGPSIYLAAEWLGRRQEHRLSGIRGVKIILLPWTPCAPVLATRSILFKYLGPCLDVIQILSFFTLSPSYQFLVACMEY